MAAKRPVGAPYLAALAAVSLQACVPLGPATVGASGGESAIGSGPKKGAAAAASLVGNNFANFSGLVKGPADLARPDTPRFDPGVGAFLRPGGRKGGAFDPGAGVFFDPGVGVFFDPGAGVFFDPGAGVFLDPGAGVFLDPGVGAFYRLAAFDQTVLGGGLVYLSQPDETLYRHGGKVVGTTTDENGHYDLSRNVLPGGLPVVVNALFAGNRRLTGFAVSRKGANRVDLDVGSTYALELLRHEARRDGKTIADYPLGRLGDLAGRARAAIASASLGVDLGNLVVGRQRQLAGDYATALAGDRNALAAWESFLGRPIRPLVTVAGIFGYGLNTAGPAPAAAAPTFGAAAVAISGTSILIADRHSHQIAEVTADGQLRPLTAVSKTDPTVAPAPPVPETGTPAITALIPSPIAVAADRQGNVFVTMSSAVDAPRNVVLMICAEPSPKFGFGRMQAGAIYRVAGGVDARSGLAGFDGPAGLAVDDAGDLYVADRRNDRIVRVSRETGIFEVVAARAPGARMSSDGDLPADGASLFMPAALAWRKTATGEELFVLDAFYQRVRAVRKAGATWAGARVITVAGSGAPVPSAGAPVVPGDFAGDGGPALSARLHLAQVDTLDWRGSELPIGGLAVDGGRSVLYVADARNGRVRAIDLATGRIATVAGGGRSARDGIALDCRLSHPVGLAVAPGGDVIVADQGAHAVRRIVTAH